MIPKQTNLKAMVLRISKRRNNKEKHKRVGVSPYSNEQQKESVCELFGGDKSSIKVIGIRHGDKIYKTLLTSEECAKAVDMGNFFRVPADNLGLNYD